MHVQLAPGRKRGAQVRPRGPSGRTRTPVDLPAFFSGLEKKRRASGAPDLCRHNMRCFYDGRPADKTAARRTRRSARGPRRRTACSRS